MKINNAPARLTAFTPIDGKSALGDTPEGNMLASLGVYRDFTCEDPTLCHPSVGALVVSPKNNPNVCTTFTVGPKLMATSKHCFSETVKAGDSCTDSVVLFPLVGSFPKTAVQCAKVIDVSADKVHKIPEDFKPAARDYVIFETATTIPRPVLSLSRMGVEDREYLVFYGAVLVTRTGDSYQDILVKSYVCKPVMKSPVWALF